MSGLDPQHSTAALERVPADRWRGPGGPASPAVFLASNAAAYVPGVVPWVNGGRLGR
jgi:2-deoxy-D-gluconate 3-dehydrogenase